MSQAQQQGWCHLQQPLAKGGCAAAPAAVAMASPALLPPPPQQQQPPEALPGQHMSCSLSWLHSLDLLDAADLF